MSTKYEIEVMDEYDNISYSVDEAIRNEMVALTTRGMYEPLIEGVHIYFKEGSIND